MKVCVKEYRLPTIKHPISRLPLYPHQVAMWQGWESHQTVLLAAKTGTGKTRAAMLPVLKRREWAVAVYPTNELLRDQVRSVAQFSFSEGVQPLVLSPDEWQRTDYALSYSNADHILVPVDGNLLDKWQKVMGCRSRGETLRRLLNPDKPKIIFTNPDILFLILGLQYHAEPLGALHRYQTLIMDEFHLYQGLELAHALAMVALARGFGFFRRLVLLSATPHPEVRVLLERAFSPAIIDSTFFMPGMTAHGFRTAVHPVEINPIQISGTDPVEVLLSALIDLKADLELLRVENPEESYIPAVVIVNSVLSAIRLEDRLVELGYSRDSIAVIRGLSNRSIRETKGKLIALGTSAIEVGVDFCCDILMFEAYEASSFLQRFGRVGRHRPGKALILMPPNVFQAISHMPSNIERSDFEERVRTWYPESTVRPWFVTTEYGMITARALFENLMAVVEKDGQENAGIIVRLKEKIEKILGDYSERLVCSKENDKAKATFMRCEKGKKNSQWIKTYRNLNRFRTSMPSLSIHDFMEQSRRQEWRLGEYDVDLANLLKRGVGIAWSEKMGMLTIRGMGKYRQVHAGEIFSDNDCGLILETGDFPSLRLYQDGQSTPVSDLMGRENHIFTVVPREAIYHELDWRLPVFPAGKYLIAFDGAALLLLELYRRSGKLNDG